MTLFLFILLTIWIVPATLASAMIWMSHDELDRSIRMKGGWTVSESYDLIALTILNFICGPFVLWLMWPRKREAPVQSVHEAVIKNGGAAHELGGP